MSIKEPPAQPVIWGEFGNPFLRFMCNVCAVCRKTSGENQKLFRCVCRSVWYCGKEHQRIHWNKHKQFCKHLKVIYEESSVRSSIQSERDWLKYRLNNVRFLERTLRRPLVNEEKNVVLFPEHCQACYASPPADLTPCAKCHIVSFCSKCQADDAVRTEHAAKCDTFLLTLQCEQIIARSGFAPVFIPRTIPDEYHPLPSDWPGYCRLRGVPDFEPAEWALRQNALAQPLAVLFGLEAALGQERLAAATSLVVHLLGAEALVEAMAPFKFEELLHWLPRLRSLTVCFVGPLASMPDVLPPVTKDLRCKACVTAERQLKFSYSNRLYHDFIKDREYSRPDIVVGLNAGVHEELQQQTTSWSPTLNLLLDQEVPMLFTAYNQEEAQLDAQFLRQLQANFLLEPRPNAFRGGQPFREPVMRNRFFYENAYLLVVRGRQGASAASSSQPTSAVAAPSNATAAASEPSSRVASTTVLPSPPLAPLAPPTANSAPGALPSVSLSTTTVASAALPTPSAPAASSTAEPVQGIGGGADATKNTTTVAETIVAVSEALEPLTIGSTPSSARSDDPDTASPNTTDAGLAADVARSEQPQPAQRDRAGQSEEEARQRQRVICVGDVHGCLAELLELLDACAYDAARDRLILVGDLVGKGPDSRGVVKYVQKHGIECVVGNHDLYIMRCRDALDSGLPVQINDATHRACVDEFDADDWRFLRSLPHYLELPEHNLLVVHAGFVPGVPLEQQDKHTMAHMRNVLPDGTASDNIDAGVAWASAWRGPQHVVFGHDAVRGLQRHEFATGLDSGCCYGRQLTALIWPERRLVSVNAKRVYSEPQPKQARS